MPINLWINLFGFLQKIRYILSMLNALTRRTGIAALILVSGLFTAVIILVFPYFNFQNSIFAQTSPQWTQETGEGIIIPACGSTAPLVTCSDGAPLVTFYWLYGGQHGPCDYVNVSVTGGPSFTSQPCTGSLPWGGAADNSAYVYNISWWYDGPEVCSSFSKDWVCVDPPLAQIDSLGNSFITPENCALPTADIKANGSDGSIPVAFGGSATISWTSTNAASCSVAPTGWTGTSNPGISTGSLTTSTTYSLSCTGPGGTAPPDSVTVNVTPNAAPSASVGSPHPTTVGTSHTHSGASATDVDGNLFDYLWTFTSCPGACPALSSASGSISGGSAAISGPTYTPTAAGAHNLNLRVRDIPLATTNPTLTETASAALTIPTVTSPTATSITLTSATLGANVTSDGGAALTARGTCWGLTTDPTTNCLAQGGLTTGIFTHARTGMPSGTTIYYRGYATNLVGTGYSVTDSFVTVANSPPVVSVGTAHGTTVGAPHDHSSGGAFATDPDGNLFDYLWTFIPPCPGGCPALSGASGGLSGGLVPAPILGPTYTPNAAGVYNLNLRVRDIPLATTNRTLTETAVTPTLTIDLSASPPSPGTAPFTTQLIADITYTGNPSDTINYSFWWNCTHTGTSVSDVRDGVGGPACGDPFSAANGFKIDGTLTDPQTTPAHTYATPGTYTAKVIVERGPPEATAEARRSITVSAAPQADLIPTAPILITGILVAGNPITFSSQEQNIGSADAPTNAGRFCIDTTNCLTDRTIFGPITAGGGFSSTITSPAWIATAGSHTVTFCVDIGAVVSESNESNNCTSPQLFTVSAAFDYSLSNSGGINVIRGSSGSNTITITLSAGATQPVTLGASGLPSGATPSFSPSSSCSPSCSRTLSVSTLTSTLTGTYLITVTGLPLSRTTTFDLIVTAPQCSDGIDNDGDGAIDHSSVNPPGGPLGNPDPGCSSPQDNSEANPPVFCEVNPDDPDAECQ